LDVSIFSKDVDFGLVLKWHRAETLRRAALIQNDESLILLGVRMERLFLTAFFLMASVASAKPAVDVTRLNHQLQRLGAGWTAKATPLSRLTLTEARHRMGLQRPSPLVQFRVERPVMQTELPPTFDWRNKDGGNWVSPILDQGNCGSCVAFASIGALETQYKIATGISAFNIKLSPQHLFSCGGGSCGWGWWPGAAAQFLKSTGVPDEACHPYLSGATGEDVACNAGCSDADRRSVRITGYSTPSRGALDIEAVKRALQNGPLVTTLTVYADFMAYASGVYRHVQGEELGGHAVSIVGYDDVTRSFVIRNSWGESWGEGGFAHVSYDDISGIGDETWSYQMPTLTGAVTLDSPRDYSYFSATAELKGAATFANAASLEMRVTGPGGFRWSQACAGKSCDLTADVSAWSDGRYEAEAAALDAGGAVVGESTRQIFYIANQKPGLTLSFTGAGVDLDRPLHDRIEMSVHATSSTVPMSSLEFHFRGPDGKKVVRSAAVVVDGMHVGWRTNLVPNGTYEIWMVGRLRAGAQDNAIESAHKTVQLAN
jgi:C1A family cysteine protease